METTAMSDNQKHRNREARYASWQHSSDNRGRKPNQKMKPFTILTYLWRYSDENHLLSAHDISDAFEHLDCQPERRAIYRDIKDINKTLLALQEDTWIDEAEGMLAEDDSNELKSIVYDPHKKGYYLQRRPLDFYDIQILAQSICSSKFISQSYSRRLIETVCTFLSEYQAKEIMDSCFLYDNEKIDNSHILYNISTICKAMSSDLNGQPHVKEKISFDYWEYAIDELANRLISKTYERKTVSPYQLLTKNGDIYLLAFNDTSAKITPYKVSHMSKVSLSGEARTGENIFNSLDLQTYSQSGFTSYGILKQHVAIQFLNNHFDAAVERFGTKKARYSTSDNDCFIVDVDVEINSAFYNWLLSFGFEAKILKPEWVAEAFLKHIDRIKNNYNEKP